MQRFNSRIGRRALLVGSAALVAGGPPAMAAAATGAVLVHGKQDGPAGSLSSVGAKLSAAGLAVEAPTMPWARGRYLSGNWAEAMGLIAGAVKSLQGRGATSVILVGHSMGCPAILSFASRASMPLAGLALTAPGHNPTFFYESGLTRESVDRARALVKAGKGAEAGTFADSNQGSTSSVTLSAADYLSFLDPMGPAVMGRYVGSIKVPVLLAVGTSDGGAMGFAKQFGRALLKGPKSRYVEVAAGHGGTPGQAADAIAEWAKSL
ncbi:alpha/beta hydrolase [uncultured Alsobacter sp.]|uniref:alpha/beta hydrolase n=1 Tax=uncultured Alsobacter sp. TaxID=1748258 RepID=UPI0025D2146C|nr:alpha/beta hydrolase [uncultured Alsobacter sp.]